MINQSSEGFEPDNNIPEPCLAAIGKVIVNWCNLEEVVDLSIAKLAGLNLTDPRSVIVTVHMSWPQKMDVLESLVHALEAEHPELVAKFEAAKPILKKAQQGRNSIVHGQWGYNEQRGGVYKMRSSARGKLKYVVELITLDDLNDIALDIGGAGRTTFQFLLDD